MDPPGGTRSTFMQRTNDRRRSVWRAALIITIGLGALPSSAATERDNPAWSSPWDRTEVQRLIVSEAVANGTVPAPLALAVVEVESGFVSRTVGASGAIGLMQLPPAVVKSEAGVAVEGDAGVEAEMLHDPATNVRLGLRRLARLHERYGGDWELALSHFRGGELPKEEGRYRAHDYTRAYVQRVMRCWRHYQRDRLVRAWIREARGAPRFVMDDADPWFGPRMASGTRSVPKHWIYASPSAYDRHRAWYSHHRGEHRPAEGCDMQALRSRPPRRFNGNGRWTALDGAPSSDFRSLGGHWVAVTGDTRFR